MTILKNPYLIIAACACVLIGLFINRPVFVDDHGHFGQALSLSSHYETPYQSDPQKIGWSVGGAVTEGNPPVYFYLFSFITRMVGSEEWKSHLAYLPFHLLALFGFFFLAKRYTPYPLLATLLWLVSPHFWLTANSLLLDGLIAPFMLAGIACWIYGWEKNRASWLIVAGLFLGLAPLVKYTAVLGWAVVIGWTFLEARTLKTRKWFALLIPLAMMTMWLLWSKEIYGQSHMGAAYQSFMGTATVEKILALLTFMSGTNWVVVLPFFLILFQRKYPHRHLILILFSISLASILMMDHRFKIGLQMGLWTGFTLAWGASVIPPSLKKDKRSLFLLGWTCLGLLGLTFARGWYCARYFVIVGPPMILLTLQSLDRINPHFLKSLQARRLTFAALCLGGLLLAHADYSHARTNLKIAADLKAWRASNNHTENLYYASAGLAGFGFYLDKTFWNPLPPNQSAPAGSVVALPIMTLSRALYPALKNPQIVDRKRYSTWNPLRTLGAYNGAGFYGSIWGPLPFSFSTTPLEEIALLSSS